MRRYVDLDLVRLAPRARDPEGKVAAALAFNAALGDPQRAQPAIQVAGTAGKGSVCTLLAHALHAAGLRTGLHTSPYLQAFCEKTWSLGRYAAPEELLAALERVRPVAERFRRDESLPASVHGLCSLALTYEVFAAQGLDVAVIETGCGGRFDLVQGLPRALSLVSDLALDHEQALGPGLERIAWHKAGIFEAGVPAAALVGPGFEVLAAEAARVGAPLRAVEPDALYAAPDRLALPALGEVALPAAPRGFRRRNLALAATGLDLLAAAGWPLRAEHLLAALAAPPPPGRLEQVEPAPRVVLDAAHNPHELEACLAALGGADTLLLALSGARDPAALLAPVRALARPPRIVATTLELYGKEVVPAADLVAAARALDLAAEAVDPPERALEVARARTAPEGTLLVTGSLFLLGRLRVRWYPTEEVVLEGSSWPARP
ncbi:MAG: folylpolyglutamate synthase/dihydrofolate synthase family protein [Planctomycetota bacterium]